MAARPSFGPERRQSARRPNYGRSAPASILVVAYRRATIALADEVVYVEHGRVLGRGPHADLLASTPGYARLVLAYEEAEQDRRRGRREEAAARARGRAGRDGSAGSDEEGAA